MTNALKKKIELKAPHLVALEGGNSANDSQTWILDKPTKHTVALCITLATLQILDGLLTGVGVFTYGLMAEANLFLREMMTQIGIINCLVVAKGFAIIVIGALCYISSSVKWLPAALSAMILFYLTVAVIPWMLILSKAYL